jgi:protein gp37
LRRLGARRGWVLDIRKQCRAANVAFFFKQWGGVSKHRTGRMLDGRTFDEMPRELLGRTALPVLDRPV